MVENNRKNAGNIQDFTALEIAQYLGADAGDDMIDESVSSQNWDDDDVFKAFEQIIQEEQKLDDGFGEKIQPIDDYDDLADMEDFDFSQFELEDEFQAQQAAKEYTGLLSNISIGSRIAMLIAIPLLILAGLGVFSYYTLNQNRAALMNIEKLSQQVEDDHHLMGDVAEQFQHSLLAVQLGTITNDEGIQRLRDFAQKLDDKYLPVHRERVEIKRLPEIVENAIQILEKGNRSELEIFLLNDLDVDIIPLSENLNEEISADLNSVKSDIVASESTTGSFLTYSIALTVLGTLLSLLLGYSIYRSISNPIQSLSQTLNRIFSGELGARATLSGDNELTMLGDSFNEMVDQRISTQKEIVQENDELNDSVFNLLEAVAELAERNLTVRAEVTEDATGPLADAINELAEQTGTVLKQVRKIAASVEAASQMVNRSAMSVNKLSEQEQIEAQATADQLEIIMQRLNSVASSAKQANNLAESTSESTLNTQKTVTSTLDNMIEIRTNVQETGKRLKRLGERSQEISQIIDVINNLSERTTVLALNASMQAASAGEAGRGFSVIAEEIQRLSENSRESTDRISTLVSNIQQEANATIANMDTTIEQVLDGSTLAEDAAQQMQATLEATTLLVNSVEQIAKSSVEQVDVSKNLQVRADKILESTQSTGKELVTLTELTRKMAGYGKQLVKSVNVFKLEA